MSADVTPLRNGEYITTTPVPATDAVLYSEHDDGGGDCGSSSTSRERRTSLTVNGRINENVLATSVSLFPPAREHLLRENHPSPPKSRTSSNSSTRSSTPTDRRTNNGLNPSPIRGPGRPSEGLWSPEFSHAIAKELSPGELKPPAVVVASQSPVVKQAKAAVNHRRGTLLGPYMFMTRDTDKRVLDKFTASDIRTMIKQLQLLEIQIKERHDLDKSLLEEKILTSWLVVHDLEEQLRRKELEDEAAEDLVYTHNQLNHMVSLLDGMNAQLVPVFEKLHDYHRRKEASEQRRRFMKSVKSFQLRTRTNQDYADRLLALDGAVRRLDRLHDKPHRLLPGPLRSTIQRINSSSTARAATGGSPLVPSSPAGSSTSPGTGGRKGGLGRGGDVFSSSFHSAIGARTLSDRDLLDSAAQEGEEEGLPAHGSTSSVGRGERGGSPSPSPPASRTRPQPDQATQTPSPPPPDRPEPGHAATETTPVVPEPVSSVPEPVPVVPEPVVAVPEPASSVPEPVPVVPEPVSSFPEPEPVVPAPSPQVPEEVLSSPSPESSPRGSVGVSPRRGVSFCLPDPAASPSPTLDTPDTNPLSLPLGDEPQEPLSLALGEEPHTEEPQESLSQALGEESQESLSEALGEDPQPLLSEALEEEPVQTPLSEALGEEPVQVSVSEWLGEAAGGEEGGRVDEPSPPPPPTLSLSLGEAADPATPPQPPTSSEVLLDLSPAGPPSPSRYATSLGEASLAPLSLSLEGDDDEEEDGEHAMPLEAESPLASRGQLSPPPSYASLDLPLPLPPPPPSSGMAGRSRSMGGGGGSSIARETSRPLPPILEEGGSGPASPLSSPPVIPVPVPGSWEEEEVSLSLPEVEDLLPSLAVPSEEEGGEEEDRVSVASSTTSTASPDKASSHGKTKRRPSMKGLVKRTRSLLGIIAPVAGGGGGGRRSRAESSASSTSTHSLETSSPVPVPVPVPAPSTGTSTPPAPLLRDSSSKSQRGVSAFFKKLF